MASPQYESSYELQDLAVIILCNSGCIGMAFPKHESSCEHRDPLYVKLLSHSGCISMAFPQNELSNDYQDYVCVEILSHIGWIDMVLPNVVHYMTVKNIFTWKHFLTVG